MATDTHCDPPVGLRIGEAARLLGVHRRTLRRYVLSGRIKTVQYSAVNVRIPEGEIKAFLDRNVKITDGLGVTYAPKPDWHNGSAKRSPMPVKITQVEGSTLTDVADRLGINLNTLRGYVAAGKIRAHKYSPRVVRITDGEVARFLVDYEKVVHKDGSTCYRPKH